MLVFDSPTIGSAATRSSQNVHSTAVLLPPILRDAFSPCSLQGSSLDQLLRLKLI